MAVTLSDMYSLATQPLKKGVFDVFRKESFVMDKLPFETSGTLSIDYVRTKVLPTITARDVGEAFTDSKGEVEPLSEQVCLLGANIDTPVEYVDMKNTIQNYRAQQRKMFATSLAYKFQDMFFNGNPITNSKEMVGIWYRLVNDLAAAQSINGGALDISPDTSVTNWHNQLIDKVDELMSLFNEGKPDVLFMNRQTLLRVKSALRQANALSVVKDQYGRDINTWGDGGPMLIDAGMKADQTTQIIGNAENANGLALTGGADTSIYAAKFGDEFLKGFQMKELEAEDVGKLESGVAYRDRISWTPGIYIVNPRSIARIYGLVAA